MRPIEVLITLTFPSAARSQNKANDHGRYASLHIEDRASGIPLIDVDLSPDEFLSIMANSSTRITTGATTSPRLDLVGKRRIHEARPLGRLYTDETQRAVIIAEATAQAIADGWEQAAPQQHNWGWALHCERWVGDLDGTS
jgi:hypothetical protein